METTALILISLTLFILVVVLVLLTLIVFKLFNDKSVPKSEDELHKKVADHSNLEFHPEILERMKDLKNKKIKTSDLFCPNHKEEPGEVTCAICDKHYCPSCVKPFKSLYFCKAHLPLIMKNDWEEVLKIEASPESPQDGVKLYDAKKSLFEEKNIPTYVETHYKINIDQNHIETYFVLFSMRTDIDTVKSHFKII